MSSHVIERQGATPIVINAPADPEMATLWNLAVAKFESRTGVAPSTREEWNQVTREYNALTTKPHGPMSQMVRERCDKAPGYD